MAQDLDLIIDLLRELRTYSTTNSETFERLLSGINNKLDILDRNSVSADFVKAYFKEIVQTLDDKNTTTMSKFSDIEKALKALYDGMDEHAKTSDMRELFELFTKNLNNFYSETRQQKAILSGIEVKLSELTSDKSDKEDILRTITLLRNDFENLNHGYKSTIDVVNSDLKTILSNVIKTEQASTTAREQIEIMYNAVADVVNFLKGVDKRDANLEKLLSGLVTNESLKFTHSVVEAIIQKVDVISEHLSSLSEKTDVEELKTLTDEMQAKLDETATKELFTQISSLTEDLTTKTDDVKQLLAKVSKNIDNLPDITFLDNSLQNLYNELKLLEENVNIAGMTDNITDLDGKVLSLNSELSTVKNILEDLNEVASSKIVSLIEDISFENEAYDIKQHVSKMLAKLPQKEDIDRILENQELSKNRLDEILNKADKIEDRLDSLPTHSDMEALNNNQLSLVENLQDIATKDDIDNLAAKSDEIEDMIDKLNFDDEFEQLYDKTTSIEDWLDKSLIKEHSEEISSQIKEKAEQKDIVEILKTTEKIVQDIEELSNNVDVKKVNRTVSEVYSMIEDLKNDFMNSNEMHHDSVVVQLSELQKSITKIATLEDFNDFVDDLKSFVETAVENDDEIDSNIREIKDYQQTILEKLDNINLSTLEENITKQVSATGTKLTSLSEYLTELSNNNKDDIKQSISEIVEILENKRSNYDEIEKANAETISSIETYLKEIKTILDTSDKSLDEDILSKISELEDKIASYQSAGQKDIGEVLSQIRAYQSMLDAEDNGVSAEALEASFAEISEIKQQIKSLGDSFNALNYDKGTAEDETSEFVAEKLNEIAQNLDTLTDGVENQLQQGFTYNAELVEEKTAALLDFIQELRHKNSDNIELYERLTVTDNKLIDFKQEMELINTDIVSALSSKSEELITEIASIRQMLEDMNLSSNEAADNELYSKLSELHDAVRNDLEECTKYSQSTFDMLEDTYSRINDSLSSTENNLRDFILGDIDSVIIKIDNLRADLDDALNRISPPEAQAMDEFKDFVNQIEAFKSEQQALVYEAAEDVKTSITQTLSAQHEELKSILAVSINNKEIISAIDDLKTCFQSKISELKRAQGADEVSVFSDEFSANQYEKPFETSENAKVVDELKADFNKFSELVSDLSEKNPEIAEVLDIIKNKMETLSVIPVTVVEQPDEVESSEDIEIMEDETVIEDDDIEKEPVNAEFYEDEEPEGSCDSDTDTVSDIIVGSNNFDIIKALDLLKQDIERLHNDVEKVISKDEQLQTSATLKSIPTLGNDNLIKTLSNKIDLLSKSLSKDWLEEIKNYLDGSEIHTMLEEINGKIDILTLSDPNSGWVDEIKQALEQLNNPEASGIVASNNQIQSMLSLINEKIDILASSDDYDVMEDVREALERIEENSTAAIEKQLGVINDKVDIIAASDSYADIEEIKDTLSVSDAKITSMLETLNHKIDKMSSDDAFASRQDVEDVKHLILSQMDYIERFEKNNKTDAFKKCLNELTVEVNNLNLSNNAKEIQKTLKDMKESIMAAVVTIFEQISFAEESEDIKDFVEEKTDAINESLTEVTKQLKQIASTDNDEDYTYSMQDIESDLAKLRLALSNAQASEQEVQAHRLSFILDNINQIGNAVEELQESVSADNVLDIQTKFDRINTDIKSLSAITNQLLKKSGESYDALAEHLTSKVDNVTKLLESSNASDKVMRQALIYMGEWIDSASESMNKISTNSEEIVEVKSVLETLKSQIPEQTDILSSIEEKFDEQQERLMFFEKQIAKLVSLEDRFEEQQQRIDRLEMSLDKILSAVEDIDDSKVTRKIDKIDKQLLKLSTNIEKLASYVD